MGLLGLNKDKNTFTFNSSQLDLRISAQLEKTYAIQLDEIADEIRRPYVDMIQNISSFYLGDIDWWVTPLASRNTYICPLFERLCKAILALRVVTNSNAIQEVVVDSPELALLLKRVLPPKVCVKCETSIFRWKLLVSAKVMRRLAITIFGYIGRILCSRFFQIQSQITKFNEAVLVDTYVYPNSIRAGIFNERHYPGILEQLTAAERNLVFWVPTFHGVKNYFLLFYRLRDCKENFLLPDNYLHLSDYLFAVGHVWRSFRKLPECEFSAIDITGLVSEAYLENIANLGSAEGLLRYRFAQRISDAGIRISRYVEWFENQEQDHGAVAGFRKAYPDTEIIGYQGFIASRTYLCMFPTAIERKFDLLPTKLAVIGQEFVTSAKEFYPGLDVIVAPAFRFQAAVRERTNEPDPNWITILVSLPIMKKECKSILTMLSQVANITERNNLRPWRFLIKPHPALVLKNRSFDALLQNKLFQVIETPFDIALDYADSLVSSASSTCVQAIARGVPVAVIASLGTLTQNPIPKTLDKRMWRVCYTAEDLDLTLKRFCNRTPQHTAALRKITREQTRKHFNLPIEGLVRGFLGIDQKNFV
jgi:hypothetical protein